MSAPPTLLKFINEITSLKNYPILDIPCGYGRNSFVLGYLACEVICLDIDIKVLNHVHELWGTYGFDLDKLYIYNFDLNSNKWPFLEKSISSIINIHYFRENLIDRFINSIIPNGYLYLETPGNQGGNYLELPNENYILSKLKPFFNIIYYKEKHAGPSDSNTVTVRVFAKRL